MKTPRWVFPLIAVMACVQPALHAWIAYCPPAGTVPTGLHVGDSGLLLYCMRMFATGFESLYATCKTSLGTHNVAFYPVPQLWIYGVLGLIARLLHVSDFAAYGFANGLGVFLYLFAVHVFLRSAVPRFASTAFLLFALSGGLGGILFIITGVFGLHGVAGFEDVFRRFADYELIEGPYLLPVLHFPRLYYTLTLALGFGSLAALITAYRERGVQHRIASAAVVLPAAFINMRFGLFVLAIAALFLLLQEDRPLSQRARIGLPVFLSGLFGVALSSWLFHANAAVIENHFQVGSVAMWLSPFATAAFFHLVLLPGETARGLRALAGIWRVSAFAAVGYLALFAALFCGYQAYYGNIVIARDGAVATAISDPALLGALAGAAYAFFRRRGTSSHEELDTAWVLLWLLFFLAVSISAFRQGWFLRFGPQRLEVLLWLPLCILSASALQRLGARTRRAFLSVMIVCGVCSVSVASLCFQAPLGYAPSVSPYASLHSEVMTDADASVMGHIGSGTVLTTDPAADIIVLRRGNPVVFGNATFNLTDQPFAPLRDGVSRFFSPSATDAFRREFVRAWCADYVYCPDTWPVASETLGQFDAAPWLERVATAGRAALFRVTRASL